MKSVLKRVVEWFSLLCLLAVVVAVGGLFVIKNQYGHGEPYMAPGTKPLVPADQLTTLIQLPFPPGNIAVSSGGRVFFNYHPFARAERFAQASVFELVDGKPVPYPSQAQQAELKGVLGMTVDQQNRLWLVRPTSLESPETLLIAIDLERGETVVRHVLSTDYASFIQDLRVSPDGETVYLTDTGVMRLTPAALIVFDVSSKTARRVLEGHPSVSAQDWQILTKDGPLTLGHGLLTFAAGVDGIALSADGAYLYYAAMNHDTLYRIATDALRDRSLSDAQLSSHVETLGEKPLSDGLAIDDQGAIYIADLANGGVVVEAPDHERVTLVSSPKVTWADGLALSGDGHLLFTDSAIPTYLDPWMRPPSRETLDRHAPYRIYRLTLPPLAQSPTEAQPEPTTQPNAQTEPALGTSAQGQAASEQEENASPQAEPPATETATP